MINQKLMLEMILALQREQSISNVVLLSLNRVP